MRNVSLLAAALILAPALAPAPGAAQARGRPEAPAPTLLTGVVHGRSASGRHALPFALVEARTGSGLRTAVADGTGRYRLEGVTPGAIRLVAVHVGYAADTVEVRMPPAGTVELDVELASSPVELPGLVVWTDPVADVAVPDPEDGTLRPSDRSSAEIALRTLEASPGLAESGLGAAARSVSGPGQPGDPAAVLFMRGSTADLKLVLLDGAPVYTPFHLGGLLQSFDPGVLVGAEHHVGGAPARYDGGLSYILDLRTRAARTDRFRASGSADLLSAGTTVEAPLPGGAGALVSARALHGLEGWLLGSGSAPYGYADALVRADWTPAAGQRLSVTGFQNRESIRLDLPGRLTAPTLFDVPDAASWGNQALTASFHSALGGSRFEVSAAASRYDAELPLRARRADQSATDTVAPVIASGVTDRFRVAVDAATPAAGGILRYGVLMDRLEAAYGARRANEIPDVPVRAVGTVLGSYVDGTHALGPQLDARWGLRLDHFQPGGSRVAARLALFVGLGPDALLTLAAGRYHQLTRRDEAQVELAVGDGTQVGTAGDDLELAPLQGGDSFLSVATADHLVVSLEQKITPSVRVGMEGFFKSFRDVEGVEGDGPLNASGVDLRLLREGGVTGWLGYSLSWFWEAPDATGRSAGFTGRHLLAAGARGRLAGPAGFETRVSFSDGLPLTSVPFRADDLAAAPESGDGGGFVQATGGGGADPVAELTDGFLRLDLEVYADLDARIAGRPTALRPYLRVLNALDRRDALFFYFEPWRDPELQPLAELSVVPVLGIRWSF